MPIWFLPNGALVSAFGSLSPLARFGSPATSARVDAPCKTSRRLNFIFNLSLIGNANGAHSSRLSAALGKCHADPRAIGRAGTSTGLGPYGTRRRSQSSPPHQGRVFPALCVNALFRSFRRKGASYTRDRRRAEYRTINPSGAMSHIGMSLSDGTPIALSYVNCART